MLFPQGKPSAPFLSRTGFIMRKHLLITLMVTLLATQSFPQSSNGPEIQVQPDTLFFESSSSADSLWIINQGISDLQIDSLTAHESYGWGISVILRDTTFYWSVNKYEKSEQFLNLAPTDSALLIFQAPDLCPICKSSIEVAPFTDTLFIFSNDTLRSPVRIFASGEGIASSVEGLYPPNPTGFKLFQNYPNPFNPSTKIQFELPVISQVSLIIYNTLGQKVRELVDGWLDAGGHQITWDGRDDFNHQVTSGVYFLKLSVNNGQRQSEFVQVKKMLLLR